LSNLSFVSKLGGHVQGLCSTGMRHDLIVYCFVIIVSKLWP